MNINNSNVSQNDYSVVSFNLACGLGIITSELPSKIKRFDCHPSIERSITISLQYVPMPTGLMLIGIGNLFINYSKQNLPLKLIIYLHYENFESRN